MIVAGLAWSLVYKQTFGATVYIILRMVFRKLSLPDASRSTPNLSGDFLLSSLAVAGFLYLIANRLLLSPSSSAAIDNKVEFAYAFDVAVNSFFPLFLTLYGAMLPLAPLVVRSNWVCLFFGK